MSINDFEMMLQFFRLMLFLVSTSLFICTLFYMQLILYTSFYTPHQNQRKLRAWISGSTIIDDDASAIWRNREASSTNFPIS